MEVESTLVPTPRKGRYRPDHTLTALFFGVPAAVVLILVLAINRAASESVLASVWSAIFFVVVVVCSSVLVPCAAIIGWKIYKSVKVYNATVATLSRKAAIEREELRLLQERRRGAQIANQAALSAAAAGDNYTITASDDSVSAQVVRASILIEQSRIQHAGRTTAQIEREQSKVKQLAAPGAGAAMPDLPSKKALPTPAPIVEAGPGEIRTFAELLQDGTIQQAISQGLILLGYVAGILRFGTWLDLYSCAVGGVTGSGKTTTVRFLLFQAILAGAKLLMVDPHIHEPEESLAAQFSAFRNIHQQKPCDDNPEAVTKRIRWFMREYRRRKAAGIKGPPIIFVLDEFNEIVALLPNEIKRELAELLMRIAQSGRKFGLFCMLIGQRWSEQDLGGKPYGAAIRTSLAATLAHRFTDEEQAKKLAGSRKASECLELAQGTFFFRDTNGGMHLTTTPYTISEDGVIIQHLLDLGIAEPETTIENDVSALEIGGISPISRTTGPLQNPLPQGENSAPGTEKPDLHTRARQIVQLQAEGVNKPDIMRQLWGVNPGASDAYKQAQEEYKRVMQFIAEQFNA